MHHSPGGGTTFAKRRHDVSNYIPPIVWWKFHENPFSRSRERLSHSFGGRKKPKKTENKKTRLHQFARSLLYNATAGGALWWFRKSHSVKCGALWWLRKSHIVSYAMHQHSPFARRRHDFRQAAARRFKLHFPPILWWKFHENPFSRSRERLSHSFGGRKKPKKCKTYTHPPPTGRRLRKLSQSTQIVHDVVVCIVWDCWQLGLTPTSLYS